MRDIKMDVVGNKIRYGMWKMCLVMVMVGRLGI